jgi:hypothetical protein
MRLRVVSGESVGLSSFFLSRVFAEIQDGIAQFIEQWSAILLRPVFAIPLAGALSREQRLNGAIK